MARGNTKTATTADIVRTVVVLLGAIALVAILFNAFRPDPRRPDPVDYSAVVELVKDEYSYDIAVPSSVPDQWRATSIDHNQDETGQRWRVGFLTDVDGFVGLEQAGGEINSFLADRMDDFESDGTSTVNGVTWERLQQKPSPHDRALMLVGDDVVTIVRGTVSYATLEEFAAGLVMS